MTSDRRGRLKIDPFSVRISKNGHIDIIRGNRTVCTIGGAAARRLAARLADANAEQTQHLLARASGHYKH